MLTIFLDEYGHFEFEDNLFVGGAVYTGSDHEEEKERIIEFLKSHCEAEGGEFPADLHRDNRRNNRNIVIEIKKRIEENIEKFLKDNGKYHIVCMIKSRKDRSDFKNVSNLVNDDIAGNLYEHMVCGLINNILFNNINFAECRDVYLELATRMAPIPIEDSKKISEFETLGYKSFDETIIYKGKQSRGFYATDDKTFRTALSSSLIYGRKTKAINIKNLNVKSINYKNYDKSMGYLYLSDFICNCISQNIYKDRKDFGYVKLYEWALNAAGGNEPLIWSYDDIDTCYGEVMNFYENKDFIGLLDKLYDCTYFESDFIDFYNKYWFSIIKSKAGQVFDLDDLDIYISKIEKSLKSYTANQDKHVFIFQQLWKEINDRIDEIKGNKIYRIADLGIRIYNHIGEIDKAEEFYGLCSKYKSFVDIQQYVETVNRQAVIYADSFDFDKALELTGYNVQCLEVLKKAKQEIAVYCDVNGSVSSKLSVLGKALSSQGQYLAYKKDKEAFKKFKEALSEFEDDEENTMKTISYILHCAVDQNNISAYEEYSDEYFGGNHHLEKQLDFIVSVKNSYMLYVFVKGLNEFYSNILSENLLEKLKTIDYQRKGFNVTGHPWELVMKNIGLLLYKKLNNKSSAERFMDKAVNCVANPETTIKAINYFTKIQKSYHEDDYKTLGKNINEFRRWVKDQKKIESVFENCFSDNMQETYENLNNKFVFMYI